MIEKIKKERWKSKHEETGGKIYPDLPTPDYTFIVSTANWSYEVRSKRMLTPKEASCIAYHKVINEEVNIQTNDNEPPGIGLLCTIDSDWYESEYLMHSKYVLEAINRKDLLEMLEQLEKDLLESKGE